MFALLNFHALLVHCHSYMGRQRRTALVADAALTQSDSASCASSIILSRYHFLYNVLCNLWNLTRRKVSSFQKDNVFSEVICFSPAFAVPDVDSWAMIRQSRPSARVYAYWISLCFFSDVPFSSDAMEGRTLGEDEAVGTSTKSYSSRARRDLLKRAGRIIATQWLCWLLQRNRSDGYIEK